MLYKGGQKLQKITNTVLLSQGLLSRIAAIEQKLTKRQLPIALLPVLKRSHGNLARDLC